MRNLAVPVEQLEQLDELLRGGPIQNGGVLLSDAARETLGWSAHDSQVILRALGFAPVNRPQAGEPIAWRRRADRKAEAAIPPPRPHSPFAALAALKDKPVPARRPRRRRKKASSA